MTDPQAHHGLDERTIGGLHNFLVDVVLGDYRSRLTDSPVAVDLGGGSGALASRLRSLGIETTVVDREANAFRGEAEFIESDLDVSHVRSLLGERRFDLVTCVEVIEHVESPIGLLRDIRALLRPRGIGLITTPNVDNLPARFKFLVHGTLRMLDEKGDPTHISPIHLDLLRRKYLPRAGLRLVELRSYPRGDYLLTRPWRAALFRAMARLWPGDNLTGDNHVIVVEPGPKTVQDIEAP